MDFQKADGPVLNAINKYKCNSSTVIIKIKIELKSIFPFTPVQYEDILRKTKNVSKASQQSDIPTKY